MTRNTRRLILRTVRLQNAVDRLEAEAAECYDLDRLFDGGEFCGAAIQRDVDRRASARAQALGFASVDVALTIAGTLGCLTREPASLHGCPLPLPELVILDAHECATCGAFTVTDCDCRLVDARAHTADDCDESCHGCVHCYRRTGETVCDQLCPHAGEEW